MAYVSGLGTIYPDVQITIGNVMLGKRRAPSSQIETDTPGALPDRDAQTPFVFSGFKADPARNELYSLAKGTVYRLEPRTMDVLLLLARNAGQVVSRQTFSDVVWSGRPVVDDSLNRCISKLRKALGDSALAPEYIRTVPKRGFCFLPEVNWELSALPVKRAAETHAGKSYSRRRRFIASLLVLALITLPLLVHFNAREGVLEASTVQPQDLMPLLSPEAGQPGQLRVTNAAQGAEDYLIERSWLEDGRARLQLRGDHGAVLWSVVRDTSTEQDRQLALSELVEAVSLANTQKTGPILRALPPAQQRLFKRARHHADRRTQADLLTARDLLQQILAYDPENVEAILLLAELQRGLASHDRTETGQRGYKAAHTALIERAKQLTADHPAVRALTYEAGLGPVDWQQYEDDLRALVAQAPDCVVCVRRLSDLYLQIGWFREALHVWEQHRHYRPLSVSVHAEIGRLQARLGNAAEALQQVELIRALAGAEAWDVLAAEVNAYLLQGDEVRWLDSLEQLLSESGELGQLRLAFFEAMLADDEARLKTLAERQQLVRDFNIALTLGTVDPLVARVQENIAVGEYRDLRLIHGWIHERNPLTRRYMDGLARLQRDTRIQALFEDIGLAAFWRKRGKHPDYCSVASSPPPYCA